VINPFESLLSSLTVDADCQPGTLFILNPRYKMIQVGEGEPPVMREELDLEETAKASMMITGIGGAR
jgi:hypothetical protein